MDIAKLEEAIDGINGTLISVYSRPPSCCRKVKTAILARAAEKETLPRLELTFKDVQEIGRELIHESPYGYVTYLNRKTLNDVLHRLMKRKLIESPYFNVPQQKHRKVFAKFNDVKYEELLLIEAVEQKLRLFDLHNSNSSEPAHIRKETDLICRIIASSAIHSAMLFRGFHEELLSMPIENIDLEHGFLTVSLYRGEDNADNRRQAFFRYFISPITLVYILYYLSLYRKKEIARRPKGKTARGILFRDKWMEDAGDAASIFRRWTEAIAKEFSLSSGMGLERFRDVSIRYLSLKYPVFLLSIQSRTLLSDSLAPYHFSPLLNMHTDEAPPDFKLMNQGGKGSDNDLRQMLGNDSALARAVFRIIALRGRIRDKADKKIVAAQIRDEVQRITNAAEQEARGPSPLLANYKIYWDWLLYIIGPADVAPGSIGTYAGSIGRHFIPLLSEQSILTSGKEYIEGRILECMKRYATNSFIKHLKLFFSFIRMEYPDADLPSLSQKKFRKTIRSMPKPLIHFKDVKKVLAEISDPLLRLMILLGFYAGLRAGEIVNLKLGNIIYDGGYVLCVRKSKTKNGARNIPLYLLMPDEHLLELITYWKKEAAQRGPGDFLFVDDGRRLDNKDTSPIIERHFDQIAGVIMEFHHLRHSFSNWVLIRWFAAIYGTDLFDPGCEFLREEVFSADYLGRLRMLLFGFRIPKKGQDSFSHVFAALARLIGHGSPRMTITHYVHVVDLLMCLWMRRKHSDFRVKLTKKTLAELLNVTHVTMPKYFAGNPAQHLAIQDIVAAQRLRLGLVDGT